MVTAFAKKVSEKDSITLGNSFNVLFDLLELSAELTSAVIQDKLSILFYHKGLLS